VVFGVVEVPIHADLRGRARRDVEVRATLGHQDLEQLLDRHRRHGHTLRRGSAWSVPSGTCGPLSTGHVQMLEHRSGRGCDTYGNANGPRPRSGRRPEGRAWAAAHPGIECVTYREITISTRRLRAWSLRLRSGATSGSLEPRPCTSM